MSKSNLTIAPLSTDVIDGVDVDGGAFDELIELLGIMPNVLDTYTVQNHEPGEDERSYIVQVHEVPGPDGEVQHIYACTCPAFKYQELPYAEDIEDDVPGGLAAIDTCKHGEAVQMRDRRSSKSGDLQDNLDSFAGGSGF